MYVGAVTNQIINAGGRTAKVQSTVEQQTHRLERAVERAVARREIRRVDSAATALAIFDLTRGLLVRRLSTGAESDVTGTRYSSPISSGGGSTADPAHAASAPMVRHPGGAAGSEQRKEMKRLQLGWVLLAILAIAPPAQAQMAESPGGRAAAAPTSPFAGSVPQGSATAEPIPLSLKDAVSRALQFNLGLLLQEQAVRSAHGAHWRALADLLPNVYGGGAASRQVINLEAYGFPGDPRSSARSTSSTHACSCRSR